MTFNTVGGAGLVAPGPQRSRGGRSIQEGQARTTGPSHFSTNTPNVVPGAGASAQQCAMVKHDQPMEVGQIVTTRR